MFLTTESSSSKPTLTSNLQESCELMNQRKFLSSFCLCLAENMNFTSYPWPNELQPGEKLYDEGPRRRLRQYKKNFLKYLKFVGDNNLDNWWGFKNGASASRFGDINLVPEQKNCICTHDIEENCYIIHKETRLVLVVGNSCIDKILTSENQGNRCVKCLGKMRGKEKHCRKCDPDCYFLKKKVSWGKKKGMPIKELLTDAGYCEWVAFTVEDPDPEDGDFFLFWDFLQRQLQKK